MTDPSADGGSPGHDPGHEPRVVTGDRRATDPQTGAVTQHQEEIDVTDSAIGGVPTSGRDVAGDDGHVTDDGARVDAVNTADTAAAADSTDADATVVDAELVEDAPAGGDGVPDPGTDDGELDRVRAELAERVADLQRVSAEYANYRRRVERDRESTVSSAKAQVAGELLTVLDDVDRATSHGDLTGGGKVVADRLTETLHRVGLEAFGIEGDPFDPAIHEAVAQETSAEVSGPTVTTVMRRGYRFGDRVLRPAMVAVTDHDPDAAPDLADQTESAAAGGPSATNPDAG